MERDLDKKLYNDYLNGEKQAFEYLYQKYKNRIQYFIYNIVRDYQKSEDLTQETFIYVMQNEMKENTSFKYFLYLVAKSKAYNHINVEKRREKIKEQYNLNEDEKIDKDVLEVITGEETKKELLNSIEQLEEKYKNAIYLVNIEGLSYEETAKILGQTLQNTKTLIHRGKKQLRKILLKKGFDEMNKASKVIVIFICVTLVLSGLACASIIIKNNIQNIQKEKSKQVKVERLKINMRADNEIIKENMQLYTENIYTLRINDYETFKEKEKELLIQFEESDIVVNEETFEKCEYEAVFITFFDITALNLSNVEPYTERIKITFTFDETNKSKKEQQSFCILIPKKYSENIIELEYIKNEPWKTPEGAITFKYREFYIENINELKNIDLEYDDNQKLYYTKYLNKDEYKEIKEKLGITTEKEILDKDLEENSVIIIFKETNNRIKFKKFRIVEGKPCIYLQETQEQYGNGIAGMIMIFKNENYEAYNVILNQE